MIEKTIDSKLKEKPREEVKDVGKAHRSVDKICRDTNQKILNDILYTKLAQQVLQQSTRSNKSDGKKVDFLASTKILSSDTIGNFKTLNSQWGLLHTNAIDYDSLAKKLNFKKFTPQPLFEFSESDLANEKEQTKFHKVQAGLKQQFKALTVEIKTKKRLQNEVREKTNNHMIEIKQIHAKVALSSMI